MGYRRQQQEKRKSYNMPIKSRRELFAENVVLDEYQEVNAHILASLDSYDTRDFFEKSGSKKKNNS